MIVGHIGISIARRKLPAPLDVALPQHLHHRVDDRFPILVDDSAGDGRAAWKREVHALERGRVGQIDGTARLVGPALAVLQRDESGLRCGERVARGRQPGELEAAVVVREGRRQVPDEGTGARQRDQHASQRLAVVESRDAPTHDGRARRLGRSHLIAHRKSRRRRRGRLRGHDSHKKHKTRRTRRRAVS